MRPADLNAAIVAITNHFFTNLSNRDFLKLAVFLSILSKNMLSMEAIRDLCKYEKEKEDELEEIEIAES